MSPGTAAAEEWPDGTYGGARPLRRPGQPDPDAAAHRQALDEALAGWTCGTRRDLRDRATSSVQPSQLAAGEGP
ncbi:hypothetical protein NW249_34500 [Streptomyces sp. OUCMDZ-4982]|uniref:hypothetical protein n=1 Tax=Streptomyces sp. OUCMDZ-4982 TaxID=2973090 RepID=UPI00215C19B8|nr:hypothetical protein [Streptomyces sp. OUCMDZ-4982]MCR8947199.1 hypothetical protein [Streptomyces sp. OUCMDZ-4982]